MTRLSLDITGELDIRLKTYLLKTYGRTHAYQQVVLKEALVAYLDAHEATATAPQVPPPMNTTVGSPHDEAVTAPVTRTTRNLPKKPRKRLSKDTVSIAKIKEMWNGGMHNQAVIAKEIGYSVSTVSDNIKRLGLH